MTLSTTNANDETQTFYRGLSADKMAQLRDSLGELDQRVRSAVREHPFVTLFGALAGGYLIGRLIARR